MIIFPAIDIKEGKVVRLFQGKFDKVTEYGHDPIAVAKHWESQGAQWLHVVDLDGAQTGKMQNFEIIRDIIKEVKIPVQVGGGIRELRDIEKLFTKTVLSRVRVILGTRVIQDKAFFKKFKAFFKNIVPLKTKVAVSLDCSNGMLAQRGWTEVSDIKATDFAKEMENSGLRCLIYTDISRDGMLSGPNISGLKEILSAVIGTDVIASGGISSMKDIRKLLVLKSQYPNLIGAITGRAIYEGKLDLKEALKLCSQSG